jgi:dipeptidyl aminopeptidase/acylaminoacyl peptidase
MRNLKLACVPIMVVAPAMANADTQIPAVVDWAGAAFGAAVTGPSSAPEISADDLIRLREIGGVSVSPDGRDIVFQVQQADPKTNAYVIRWFVAPSDGSRMPVALSFDGGQPIAGMLFGRPYAFVPPPYAKWSPDGRRIAIRRLVGHRIGLWVVDARTGAGTEVADGAAQVTKFGWSSSNTLVYRTGLRFAEYERSIDAESARGWLWDSRVVTFQSNLRPAEPDCEDPTPDAACDNQSFAFDVGVGRRSATPTEAKSLSEEQDNDPLRARGAGGVAYAKVVDQKYAGALSPLRQVAISGTLNRECNASECIGGKLKEIGWSGDGRSIWFLKIVGSVPKRVDGAPGDFTDLYGWTPSSGKVRLIKRVDGTLDDCHTAAHRVVCKESMPTTPPRIIAIELGSRHTCTIADPNPSFKTKKYPKVEKILLKDPEGGPYYANLVYPNNYRVGVRYPLVITQYAAKGFLRGQVGNEYPIFPLAAQGFVVLSVNWGRPPNRLATMSNEELNRGYSRNGREIVWKVIESGLDKLIDRGLVDSNRVAITGLSAGAEVTNYILQRTDRFAAAITSSAAQDVTFFALAPEGPTRTRVMKEFSSETIIPSPDNSIFDMAWSNKPEALRTPLLTNVGEYEAMMGFEGTQAIIHAGGPLEIHIFPDEQHIKIHPRTYVGIYQNNIQWLRYWLMNERDPAPELVPQYLRWDKMAQRVSALRSKNSEIVQSSIVDAMNHCSSSHCSTESTFTSVPK